IAASTTTKAFVDDGAVVNAAKDIQVTAKATEKFVTITAGVAGGFVGVGGAAAVIVLDNVTYAYIGDNATSLATGTKANAGGSILVSAADGTDVFTIVGNLAAGAVGVGGSAAVTILKKDTRAWVGSWAQVDAKGGSSLTGILNGTIASGGSFTPFASFRGLAVQATSSEKIFTVVVNVAGGFYAGIGGSVSVTIIDSDTTAFIGANARVNQDSTGASSLQSVSVAAANDTHAFVFT